MNIKELNVNIEYIINNYFITLLNIPLYSISSFIDNNEYIINSDNESIMKKIYNHIKELNLTIVNHGDFCMIIKIDNNFDNFLMVLKLKGKLKCQ